MGHIVTLICCRFYN